METRSKALNNDKNDTEQSNADSKKIAELTAELNALKTSYNAGSSNADSSNADSSNADSSNADSSNADSSNADSSNADSQQIAKLTAELDALRTSHNEDIEKAKKEMKSSVSKKIKSLLGTNPIANKILAALDDNDNNGNNQSSSSSSVDPDKKAIEDKVASDIVFNNFNGNGNSGFSSTEEQEIIVAYKELSIEDKLKVADKNSAISKRWQAFAAAGIPLNISTINQLNSGGYAGLPDKEAVKQYKADKVKKEILEETLSVENELAARWGVGQRDIHSKQTAKTSTSDWLKQLKAWKDSNAPKPANINVKAKANISSSTTAVTQLTAKDINTLSIDEVRAYNQAIFNVSDTEAQNFAVNLALSSKDAVAAAVKVKQQLGIDISGKRHTSLDVAKFQKDIMYVADELNKNPDLKKVSDLPDKSGEFDISKIKEELERLAPAKPTIKLDANGFEVLNNIQKMTINTSVKAALQKVDGYDDGVSLRKALQAQGFDVTTTNNFKTVLTDLANPTKSKQFKDKGFKFKEDTDEQENPTDLGIIPGIGTPPPPPPL